MSRLLTVRQICERALRKIGAYSINDTGADPEHLEEARLWLDMLVGHVAADQRCWFLVEETSGFALTADTASYDLNSALGLTDGDDKVQFPVKVMVREVATSRDIEIEIIGRQAFESIPDKDATGRPARCYISRDQDPTIQIHPVPADDDLYEARIVWQTWAPDLSSAQNPEFVATQLRSSWNLWTVTALAAQIGDGPVLRLPSGEVSAFKKDADKMLDQLWAYDNHESRSGPPQTAYHDF